MDIFTSCHDGMDCAYPRVGKDKDGIFERGTPLESVDVPVESVFPVNEGMLLMEGTLLLKAGMLVKEGMLNEGMLLVKEGMLKEGMLLPKEGMPLPKEGNRLVLELESDAEGFKLEA